MGTRPAPCARETFLDVTGCRLRVWRGGDGPPLLVVTDCGDPLELWTESFEALARRYEVTMVEQPGFGYSDAAPEFDYRWRAHLDALRDACDRLKVGRTLAVGHCVGGTQLLALDADAPGRCRAVVLAETFPAADYRRLGIGLPMHRVARVPFAGGLVALGGDRLVARGARHLLGVLGERPDWPDDETLDRYVAPIREGHNRDGGLRHVRRWDGGVAEPIERASRVPAAYLLGAGGRFARHLEIRRAYAQECGRAVVLVEGAGHFPFAEQPVAFVAAVTGLLDDLDPVEVGA